jgi:hypothetical protein
MAKFRSVEETPNETQILPLVAAPWRLAQDDGRLFSCVQSVV